MLRLVSTANGRIGPDQRKKRKTARKPLAVDGECCKLHSRKLIRKTLHPVKLPDVQGMTQKTEYCNGVLMVGSNANGLRNVNCNVFVLSPDAPGGK